MRATTSARGRIAALIVGALVSTGCGVDLGPVPLSTKYALPRLGHAGARVEGAVRVVMTPTTCHRDRTTFPGSGVREGNPFFCVHAFIKNVSEETVKIRRCSAEALDEDGPHLFTVVEAIPYSSGIYEPGQEFGEIGGHNRMRLLARDGITQREVTRVARYEVRCHVFQWIEPTPVD